MEVYDRIRDIRYLFLAITKGKQEMTSNEFVRTFQKSAFLRQLCGIKQADLIILYQKVGGRERTISIYDFFNLLLII